MQNCKQGNTLASQRDFLHALYSTSQGYMQSWLTTHAIRLPCSNTRLRFRGKTQLDCAEQPENEASSAELQQTPNCILSLHVRTLPRQPPTPKSTSNPNQWEASKISDKVVNKENPFFLSFSLPSFPSFYRSFFLNLTQKKFYTSTKHTNLDTFDITGR